MTPMQMALWGTIAIYGLLALLVLNLSIFSLWRWWVKGGVMIVTGVVFVGAYSVISASGLIMRRGHELERVLRVFDPKLSLVAG